MEQTKAFTGNKTFIVDGEVYYTIIVICPNCGHDLRHVTHGLAYCPRCCVYFEIGIRRIEE